MDAVFELPGESDGLCPAERQEIKEASMNGDIPQCLDQKSIRGELEFDVWTRFTVRKLVLDDNAFGPWRLFSWRDDQEVELAR